MQKIFILDTNVLLHATESLEVFQEHEVIIHLTVLNELDRKKNEPGLIGRNARTIANKLLDYAKVGALNEGVIVNPHGGTVKIDVKMPFGLSGVGTDDFLIGYAGLVQEQVKDKEVVLVSKDKYLQIKAKTLGVYVEDYLHDHAEEVYEGHINQPTTAEAINTIYREKSLPLPEVINNYKELPANLCITLNHGNSSALCVVNTKTSSLDLVSTYNGCCVVGLKPMNAEQRYLLHLLLDPDIHLVTVAGATGSGKTLLALAAGIQQQESGLYDKVIVTRKEVAVGGNKTGFLPGDEQEKAGPWMKGIFGCLDKIAKNHISVNTRGAYNHADKPYQCYTIPGIVTPEPLDYVRGTTFEGYTVIDEAQNFHKDDLKTLITRAGKNCKVVVCGDLGQIDTKFLDRYSNGLSYVIDKFKGWERYAHITLKKTVRSELAKEAEQRL